MDRRAAEAAPTPQVRSREKIEYIEYFRAIAIILIVSGHAFDLAWSQAAVGQIAGSEALLGVASALLNGGTFYFVFISGFLYRHIFYNRVPFGDMMQKKALYVGAPYLLLGTIAALMQMEMSGFHVIVLKHGGVLGENPYLDFIIQLATGQMMTAYWYIPFIFVVFLASPLFDLYIRMPATWRLIVLALAGGAAFWVHRPYESLNPVHCFIYYAGAYMLGILFCEYRERLMPLVSSARTLIVLGALVLGVALYQYFGAGNVGMVERSPGDGWWPKEMDWMIVQKTFGAFFLCGLLARHGDRIGSILSFVARASFGIYFMHGIVLVGLHHLPAGITPHTGSSPFDFMIYVAAAFLISLAAVMAIKALTGRYSRYVIGS